MRQPRQPNQTNSPLGFEAVSITPPHPRTEHGFVPRLLNALETLHGPDKAIKITGRPVHTIRSGLYQAAKKRGYQVRVWEQNGAIYVAKKE
jgi:hypothetical protein